MNIKELKEVIEAFLNDSGCRQIGCRQIVIQYSGKGLNAACDWANFRNPLLMILRGFLGEVLKKLPPCSIKNHFYRLMGVKIGRDVVIGPDVLLDPLFPELITIEDGAILGWGCKIFAHEILIGKITLGKIVIGKRAIVGANSVVRSGVTIGENSTVSFCSFVNKEVKSGETVGGIPARKIEVEG